LPEANANFNSGRFGFLERANTDSFVQTLSRFDAIILGGSHLSYADLPVPSMPCTVQSVQKFCVSVGNLEARKITDV
jgi:hypothetical protein